MIMITLATCVVNELSIQKVSCERMKEMKENRMIYQSFKDTKSINTEASKSPTSIYVHSVGVKPFRHVTNIHISHGMGCHSPVM